MKLKIDVVTSKTRQFASLSPLTTRAVAGTEVQVLGRNGNAETSMGQTCYEVKTADGKVFTVNSTDLDGTP